MVPPTSHEVPRVSWYSGYYHVNLTSLTRLSLSLVTLPSVFSSSPWIIFVVRNPRCISTSGLGSFAFARRYLQNRFFFLLLWVLRCFSSPRLPSHTLCIHVWISRLFPLDRFPHSDSHGSIRICQSPWIIAAYRVLLRLSVPRHSPYALRSLTLDFTSLVSLLFSVYCITNFIDSSRLRLFSNLSASLIYSFRITTIYFSMCIKI